MAEDSVADFPYLFDLQNALLFINQSSTEKDYIPTIHRFVVFIEIDSVESID